VILQKTEINFGANMKFSKQNLVIGFASLVLVSLVLLTIFSDHGLIDYYRLQSKLDAIKQENEMLAKENSTLKRVIKRLHKNDPELIEHIARNELGMTGKDEVIFIINKP